MKGGLVLLFLEFFFFFFPRMTESGPLPWDMLPWAERAEAGWGRRQTDWCFP